MTPRILAVLGAAVWLTLSAPLASCAPILKGQAVVTVAKAHYAFETAYNTAAHAYLDALDAGVLTPAQRAQARPILQRAYKAVQAARTADRLGNADGLAAQGALAMQLARQVIAIVKPGS